MIEEIIKPTLLPPQPILNIGIKTRLFSKVLAAETVVELQSLFNAKASEYWKTHYQFNETVENDTEKKLGIATINSIIINVIVP